MIATKQSRWAAILVIAVFVALHSGSECSAQEIKIIPRNPGTVGTPLSPDSKPILMAKAYVQIYDSIGFLSALQDVHPYYRHEVTMRILFGEPGCCCDCAGRAGQKTPPNEAAPEPKTAFPKTKK
jgi:hypothetical protein